MRTASIGRTSWRMEFAVHHCESGELLARAEQVMVLIDRAARQPTPVPDDMARRRRGLRGQRVSIAEQVQAIVDGGEEADEILRASLAAVHEAAGAPWSAIAFVEEGEMVVGPLIGAAPDGDAGARADRAHRLPRRHGRRRSGSGARLARELDADLARVAALLAPYCLVGWDTGGEELGAVATLRRPC